MEVEKKNKPHQIGIPPELYERLFKFKEQRARKLGINLSWNDFFTLLLKDEDGARR